MIQIINHFFQRGDSALVMILVAKNLGFENIIDIGSGDGRLIYCGSILGLNAVGIEIDKNLSICKMKYLFLVT